MRVQNPVWRANWSRVLAEKESLRLESSPWSQYKDERCDALRSARIADHCVTAFLKTRTQVKRVPSVHLLTLDVSE